MHSHAILLGRACVVCCRLLGGKDVALLPEVDLLLLGEIVGSDVMLFDSCVESPCELLLLVTLRLERLCDCALPRLLQLSHLLSMRSRNIGNLRLELLAKPVDDSVDATLAGKDLLVLVTLLALVTVVHVLLFLPVDVISGAADIEVVALGRNALERTADNLVHDLQQLCGDSGGVHALDDWAHLSNDLKLLVEVLLSILLGSIDRCLGLFVCRLPM